MLAHGDSVGVIRGDNNKVVLWRDEAQGVDLGNVYWRKKVEEWLNGWLIRPQASLYTCVHRSAIVAPAPQCTCPFLRSQVCLFFASA